MKKVITYGTYDLLHEGHINLLRRAKELGDFLIVGVTSDRFDRERGKLNVCNNVLERVEAVRKTGFADQIIIEDYFGQKIDDIQKYDVDVFAIGSDWTGSFDYLNEFCEVKYLPRTEGISSTMLRDRFRKELRVGVIGSGRIAKRFVPETKYVSEVRVTSVYNPNDSSALEFARRYEINAYSRDFVDFLNQVDAVYIASPHLTHYDYIKKCLNFGKHVLCEIPFLLNSQQAREVYELAEQKHLVVLEASKTAFCSAFNHLVTLVKSGGIGEVVDIKVSLSKLVSGNLRELDASQAGGSMTELSPFPLMSILKLLGREIKDIHYFSKMSNGVDIFTKGIFVYDKAIATITLGLGVKTEGDLVISGTKGYVIVPSPWWLTSYFEMRFEDQNLNKKYFYSYLGDGLRYEIQEFVSMIFQGRLNSYKLPKEDSIKMAEILEDFLQNSVNKVILN